jgi:TolB-like protein
MFLKRHLQSLVVTLCFIFLIQAQQQSKLQIAVIDLSNTGGLSQQESVTLTNRLRSMLVLTDAFIVLERGKMEGILQEQGFQQTGCTSTECVVEMGKLLNVQKIISGSIGKVGRIYTIDISLVDINTARIERSFIFDHEGEIGGLLKMMETIADDIAVTVTGKEKKVETYGSLEVETDPKKASVFLDNEPIGKSPVTRQGVPSGSHMLEVKENGYDTAQKTVIITENKTTKIEIELKKLYKMTVTSKPAGAKVLINNKDAGETPYTTTVKEDMKFELKLAKENYKEWKKNIKVGDDIEIDRELEFTDAYKKALSAKAKREKELAEKAKREQELAEKAKRDKERQAKEKQEQEKKALAKKDGGGGSKWLWIGGGAAVLAGGAAAFFILSQEDEEEKQDEGMPRPIGRP